MEAGRSALAFPSFGPERRGAPMRAFTKISDGPIGDRSACSQADFVVYLDDTLLGESWESELKPGGCVLVNSVRQFDDPRIMSLDADGLSAEVLGRPIPNTVLLGALARLCDAVSLDDVGKAIRASMAERLHEPNCAIAAQAHALANGLLTEGEGDWDDGAGADSGAGGVVEAASEAAARAIDQGEAESAKGPRANAPVSGSADVVRAEDVIPRLRNQLPDPDSLDPASYARTTCFTAGHLVTKNAGWRSQRPVVDQVACTACRQCVQYCPDGAMFMTAKADVEIAQVDLDFCKGCGICATVCRFGAIAMVPEHEAAAAKAFAANGESDASEAPVAADGYPVGGSFARSKEVSA